jgi:glycosyltransferase involved in cell wall biosynthesis
VSVRARSSGLAPDVPSAAARQNGRSEAVERPGVWPIPAVNVVIPCRDEARNVGWVLERLPRFVSRVVIVDGSRSYDTELAVRASWRGELEVIRQPQQGKGAAVIAGLFAARGEIVVMLDADGSMDPVEIPLLVAALLAGADVAKGSRALAGAGSHDLDRLRRVGNRLLTVTANTLYRANWSELCYGYAAFWTDVLPALSIDQVGIDSRLGRLGSRLTARARRGVRYGHGFEIEAILFARAARAGLRVTEVASFEHPRRSGHSHLLAWRDGVRVLTALLNESRYVAPVAPVPARSYPIRPAVVAADVARGDEAVRG